MLRNLLGTKGGGLLVSTLRAMLEGNVNPFSFRSFLAQLFLKWLFLGNPSSPTSGRQNTCTTYLHRSSTNRFHDNDCSSSIPPLPRHSAPTTVNDVLPYFVVPCWDLEHDPASWALSSLFELTPFCSIFISPRQFHLRQVDKVPLRALCRRLHDICDEGETSEWEGNGCSSVLEWGCG